MTRRRALRRRFGHMGIAAYNRGSRAISAQIDRQLAGRVKQGRYCGGSIRNGPGKAYGVCSRCGRIDYEAYEGDKCVRIIA